MFGYLSAGVVERGEPAELVLDRLGDIQGVDEVPDGAVGDGLPGAGQSFESLIGIGISLPAEYGLDALGYDLPVVGEIPLDGIPVEYQFA